MVAINLPISPIQRNADKAIKKNHILKQARLNTNRYHDQDTASVSILMSVHNGARFISEQIDSIVSQSHSNWSLHISDDDSSDGSNRIIRAIPNNLQKRYLSIMFKIMIFARAFYN